MRIYRKVVLDFKGRVVEEDSFEYHGKVTLCKHGQIAAQKSAQATSEKSYQLQLQQQTEEKKRLDVMAVKAVMEDQKEDQKVKDAALKAEQELQKKRKGTTSTILTGGEESLGTPNISKKSLYA